MSISCPLVRRLLSRYLDAELSDRKAARVDRHLAVCPSCQRELDMYVETVRFVEEAATPDVPGGAWDRIAAQLSARGIPGFGPPGARAARVHQAGPSFRVRPIAVAAAVLAAVGLAFSFPSLLATFGPQPALAHEIDIEAFWNGLDLEEECLDLEGFFAKVYQLRVADSEEVRKACAAGEGPASELPAGFTLTRSMLIQTDCCAGMALEYRSGDNWLAIVQIPSHHPMAWNGLPYEVRRVGTTEFQVHGEEALWSLILNGNTVNVLVAGDSDLQVLGRVATFLVARAESAVSSGTLF